MTMLPDYLDGLEDLEFETYATKTYHVRPIEKRISGHADGIDALVQAIHKILRTERYAYPIYSDSYGVELEDLIGEDIDFVRSEVPRRIEEAIMVDDRVESVDEFDIKQGDELDTMVISFVVTSEEGMFEMGAEVLVI